MYAHIRKFKVIMILKYNIWLNLLGTQLLRYKILQTFHS
jgi:hypothetical protein